jgi:hypothetical protein
MVSYRRPGGPSRPAATGKPPRIRRAIALPLDDDDPSGAAASAALTGRGRPGGALFAALKRLSGPRLKPGRRAVTAAAAFVLVVSAIGGIAALTLNSSSGDSKDVAATRPAGTSADMTSNSAPPASTWPGAAGPAATSRNTTAHQKPPAHRRAAPGGKGAGHSAVPAGHLPSSSGGGTGSHSTTKGGGGTSPKRTPVAPAPPPATVPFHITGQLLCESGHAVVGVWVQTAKAGDSRYASWKGLGDGSTADWWTDLPRNESYSLHVGCGGTPSSWRTSNTTHVYSGGHNSFNCDDISGDSGYEKCAHR